METIYDIIKANAADKGEDIMWASTKIISDAVEEFIPADAKDHLRREVYELMCGGHFNEHFAKEAVRRMYYTDDKGDKHYAPFWTDEQVREVYDSVKSRIKGYNCWDFYCTLHMTVTDMRDLLMKWFPGDTKEDRVRRYVEASVNWLCDEDNPYGNTKIWSYLNASR